MHCISERSENAFLHNDWAERMCMPELMKIKFFNSTQFNSAVKIEFTFWIIWCILALENTENFSIFVLHAIRILNKSQQCVTLHTFIFFFSSHRSLLILQVEKNNISGLEFHFSLGRESPYQHLWMEGSWNIWEG